MRITFNGVTIAQGPDFKGSDSIKGFLPQGKQELQVVPCIRAQQVSIFARGNAQNTITGQIRPASFPTLAAALAARGNLFATLLQVVAPLVFEVGGETQTYSAALESFRVIEAVGVAIAYELTFQCGLATPGSVDIETEAGVPILTESGAVLTRES